MVGATQSSWLEAALARYTWALIALTTLGAAFVMVSNGPSQLIASVVMIGAVGLLGLPHGAFDLEAARQLFAPVGSGLWMIPFIAVYLLLAAAGIILWHLAPVPSLILLLVGGAVHWGADDVHLSRCSLATRVWLSASRGSIPVALPLLFHPQESAEIFVALTGSAAFNSSGVFTAGAAAMTLAAAGVIAESALGLRDGLRVAIRTWCEVLALIVWFAAVEPLLAFTVYFCLWHAVRHSLRSMATLDRAHLVRAGRLYAGRIVAPTIATWIVAAGAWIVLLRADLAVEAIWQIVFVGLFALTIPHVVLDLWRHRLNIAHAQLE